MGNRTEVTGLQTKRKQSYRGNRVTEVTGLQHRGNRVTEVTGVTKVTGLQK